MFKEGRGGAGQEDAERNVFEATAVPVFDGLYKVVVLVLEAFGQSEELYPQIP